jgi:hypothetical protein
MTDGADIENREKENETLKIGRIKFEGVFLCVCVFDKDRMKELVYTRAEK